MTEYRRAHIPGATWFFTVNLAERHGNRLLVSNIDLLRQVFRQIKSRHPFAIDAMVVLPEHLHCIWTLPAGDSDYQTRWALIKAGFSRQPTRRGKKIAKPCAAGRAGHLAASLLGACDSRRARFHAARRLHSLESLQAWLGEASRGLAPFELPRLRAAWSLFTELGV